MAQSKAQDFRDGPLEFAAAAIIQGALIYLSYKGAVAMQLGDELVALITIVMGAASFLASLTISRVLTLWARQPVRTAVAAGLGIVFVLIEAALTHVGLEFLALEANTDSFPTWALWPASIGLSAANVGVKWAFIGRATGPKREGAKTTKAAPRRALGKTTLRAVG